MHCVLIHNSTNSSSNFSKIINSVRDNGKICLSLCGFTISSCIRFKPLSTLRTMKRQRPPVSPPTTTPKTPLSRSKTTTLTNSISSYYSSKKPRKTLLSDLKKSPQNPKWVPLNLDKSELCLHLTFPTGQTFRWKQTSPFQYTGVVGSHLVSLKQFQDENDSNVAYCFHNTPTCDEAAAKSALLDFLNMGICLSDLWDGFSAADSRFAGLTEHLSGARVLRQEPLECLVQFICSSNNNIKRITQMVDFLSSMGNHLGVVDGIDFYEFPSLDRLSKVSEEELRQAGFGYRAKYITGTVDALQSKSGGGVEWLASLRKLDLQSAVEALTTLPGVGPKVAACIALFSLDQHHAIPVDTHVWKIATRYLIPELAGARLTPKLCSRVADAFVEKYGRFAGWAQTLLFIAELPSQKALLPSLVNDAKQAAKGRESKRDGNDSRSIQRDFRQQHWKTRPLGGCIPHHIIKEDLHGMLHHFRIRVWKGDSLYDSKKWSKGNAFVCASSSVSWSSF